MEQESEWRYTDHVCLPPRVEMEDVWGEMSLDCGLYRFVVPCFMGVLC